MQIACYIRCRDFFNEIRQVLAAAGFDCQRFDSEISLLRALRREGFDLVLADTESDSVEAKTFYSWLNCRSHSSMPVVLLSSTADASSTASALNAGADDFIDWPCDPRILIARLRVVLRSSSPTFPGGVVDIPWLYAG